MATSFDRERGVHSGRIVPQKGSPSHGDHVFVLGSENSDEPALLSDGDYTEVKQRIDLTGYDILTATMNTIGAIIGERKMRSGFSIDPDSIFHFNFDVGTDSISNLISDRFDLLPIGTINVKQETYSPDGTYCRSVPEGAAAARLVGQNLPQSFPVTLNAYTVQWWMNFDSSVYSVATGITPIIMMAGHDAPLGAGICIELSPIAGTHTWRLMLRHFVGATPWGTPFSSYLFDQPLGWKMFTLRYDNTASPQADLFVNTVKVSSNANSLPPPSQLQAGSDISFLSKELVGDFDQVRMINRCLSDSEIVSSYNQCVSTPSSILYKWVMMILIDDIVYLERQIRPDENRTWTDIAVPVKMLTGEHSVSFRLQLELL